ncbi:MAG: peptidoglycan bridge formation glycyltransferase FemA/FemB family protein [Candidatus Omnitrophica bacterium]|nr:peptidoglycan bridge formation glycyltransferase FemA/FemB family protein [Candidatus Omnitrophota bacterium]
MTDNDKPQWEDLVRSTPESGFMQSWAWSSFKELEGQTVLRLGVFSDDVLCAGTIVYYVLSSVGASALEMPYGPVLPWGKAEVASQAMDLIYKELEKISAETGAPLARIEPFIEGVLPSFMGKVIRAPLDLIPTPTLIIPIDKEDNDILAQMTAKGRYNIKLAQKKSVEVYYAIDEDAIEDFYYLFELTYHRHNFAGEPRSYFESMLRALKNDNMIRVYFSRYKGMLMGAAIAIFYGKRATFLYGGSTSFFSSVMAAYGLHWQMMKDARAVGCCEYDFFGIAPDGKPDHPYSRFSQFKFRFGGKKFVASGAHDMYFYSQLAKMWIKSIETAK